MEEDLNHFEWLVFQSYKNKDEIRQAQLDGKESLQALLQKRTVYQLKKVKKTKGYHCYLKMLLDWSLEGRYIAQLQYDNGNKEHTVGIDMKNKIIFDCMEPFAMHLTKENLNYISGTGSAKIESIPIMYEIVRSNKKRKSK